VYSVFLWRRGFQQDNRVIYLLLLTAFGLHTTAMALRGAQLQQCPVTNLYEITTFVSWTIIAVYLVVGVWSRLRFLGAFASPIVFAVGVFALMPALDLRHGGNPDPAGIWTSLHAAIICLACGAFGLSAAAALMYLTQERNLKFHRIKGIFSLMPPIQRLELIVSALLLGGFILLTIGLALGALGLTNVHRVESHGADPEIIWSVLVWTLYLALLVMRWKFAQTGRRFALGVVGTFAFLALTGWGIFLLSPLHNQ
jgi:HemX protein